MGLKQKIKKLPALYNGLLFILNALNYFDWNFHRRFPRYKITPYWTNRIEIVKACPENLRLHHVDEAGKINQNYQLLHNGVKITLGSYYDFGNTHLLLENKGVHEPQEEFAFDKILSFIPARGTMMELGSYWAFYSIWFALKVSEARCIMIEPDPHKMNFGKLNLKLNAVSGIFDLGFIGDHPDLRHSIPVYSVDYLMEKHGVNHLNILHSDIQGYELKMLEGCQKALEKKAIDYFFISTHSNELHQACIAKLIGQGYQIVCEANLEESYSVDGLIVAKQENAAGPSVLDISKR